MPRAAIYARFSSELSNEKSAEDQARVCRERAEREGWDVVEVYSDLAISGTTNRRPGLIALLADAEAGLFEIVVAEALDRIARDQADIATIYKRLVFAGVQIFTLSEERVSELHIGLMGTMNALYVKELKAKIRRGQKGAVARGRVSGGRCYGYDPAPRLREDGTVDRGFRKINEAEAAVVRRVYAEFIAGRSPREIAHRLNQDGIPAPRGGEWRQSSIGGHRARQLGLLHNPIYSGRFVYNRVTMVQDPETRKRLSRSNPAAERIVQEIPELRIIDEESWLKVQEWHEAHAGKPARVQRRPKHLFSGIVRCATCGGRYSVISADKWGCTRHREAGTCDNPRRISTAALERRVLGGLKRELLSPDAVSLMMKAYHDERARIRAEKLGRRQDTARRLATARAAVDRLVQAIADGGADFLEIREALAARRGEMARAEADLAEYDAPKVIALHPQLAERYREKVENLSRSLAEGVESRVSTMPHLRGLIDTIEVGNAPGLPDNASITVTGSLAAAIGLATGAPAAKAGTVRTVQVVAEEGLEPPTRGL